MRSTAWSKRIHLANAETSIRKVSVRPQMRLSRIESLAAAAVLEDCSDELDVLGLTVALRADKQRGPARAKVTPRGPPAWL